MTHFIVVLLSFGAVVGLIVLATSNRQPESRTIRRRLALRALLGAIALGGTAAVILRLLGYTNPDNLIIYSSAYGAAGAVAGIASLWRERGLPPWTCVAVVAACMLVARLTTVLVVGFRKLNPYPVTPTLLAAAAGVVFVLVCRKPVNKAAKDEEGLASPVDDLPET